MRPFNTVGCDGFLDLIQKCLVIQSRSKGLLDARELLHDPSTVSRNVDSAVEKIKASLVKFFEDQIDGGVGIAFTTDMYDEKYTKLSYTALTAHWLDSHFDLHHATLGCKTFPK